MADFELFFIWRKLIWAVPPLLAVQVMLLPALFWRVGPGWQPDQLAARSLDRWLLQIGVVIAPVVMLIISAAFAGGYQGERGGHWFFHTHSGLAGLVLVPVYFAGSVILGRSLATGRFRVAKIVRVVLFTFIGICLWYAYATAFLRMGDDHGQRLGWTAFAPLLAATNYTLLTVDIYRHGRRATPNPVAVYAWFAALAVSLLARVPLARNFYASLPSEPPKGYGDCFVVSAAAFGHPAVVGSRTDPQTGRPVNRQLQTLRQFETLLAQRHPAAHARLRARYNRAGPWFAARIRNPFAADAMYIALKPLEWMARLLTRAWRGQREFQASPPRSSR